MTAPDDPGRVSTETGNSMDWWDLRATVPPPGESVTEDELEPRLDRSEGYWDVYQRSVRNVLWHYTSLHTLLKILESKEIWATEIRYLSDSLEYDHAVERLGEAINSRLPGAAGPAAELLPELLRIAEGAYRARPMIFVFCLSKVEDDLAQWRGYTPEGAGVALGFETGRLQMFAGPRGFRLAECLYRREDQIEALLKLVDGAIDRLDGIPLQQACDEFYRDFLRVAPTIKASPFSAEREWRLISKPFLLGELSPEDLDCRVARTTLVPYVKIPFRHGNPAAWPVCRLWIGPTPHLALNIDAVRVALNHAGVMDPLQQQLAGSQVPYRPWV